MSFVGGACCFAFFRRRLVLGLELMTGTAVALLAANGSGGLVLLSIIALFADD